MKKASRSTPSTVRRSPRSRTGGIQPGMHTDNWRTLSGSFDQAVDAAVEHGLEFMELMVKILKEFDSPWLGVNFDTGNTFVAGHDPLTYLKAVRPWLRHVHCKDVPGELAAARGEDTGVACSSVSIGRGANAANIKACIDYLRVTNWDGVFSIETLGTPDNLRESVAWLRSVI